MVDASSAFAEMRKLDRTAERVGISVTLSRFGRNRRLVLRWNG